MGNLRENELITSAKGRMWPAEWSITNDLITGIPMRQLTNYMSHSFHLYFTNNGWYDDGNKLLLGSDRTNCTNLFSIDLNNGEMMQLTDFRDSEMAAIQNAFINPMKNEAYFSKGKQIISIDLETLEEKVLYEVTGKYVLGNLSCTSDGKWICTCVKEDLSDRIQTILGAGYIGFEETAKAMPHCKIVLIPAAGGEAKVIHEEHRWIGHVNTSPTQPHLLSFCHEGPWDLVDHRIWCLNIQTGEHWKIRASEDNVFVGHEYWHDDGVRIGYHGYTESLQNKDGKFIGSVRYDNTECDEVAFPFQNMHVHSNDSSLIVGDGQQTSAYHGDQFQDTICLWKKIDDKLDGPRILCRHRGSFQSQKLHVHPRFSPDGTKVLFTSDMTGYGNLYIVDVPEFETLPKQPL
ncbi:PD40 domain-containing protein [Paenibacillus alginolyticus]|uniref:PD40 domain-containing protein n=1 Tax=Paenibacillus alginolyticus TaxID=59839 RepID=A0ABT4GMN9_9BACL|nr:oligogalacturonate lyase family protein [Paenibacillus alginolyticus]MCY9668123.1 PD40 domain-containing protein [Paenibacillus alginolyticus]MCY9697481.1 PD40 domain-containing protein [Paenibacillus alginolyticus]MEC0148283.1 oligogalacturonate lyase family protein [Paenibacillus alginolyticus]